MTVPLCLELWICHCPWRLESCDGCGFASLSDETLTKYGPSKGSYRSFPYFSATLFVFQYFPILNAGREMLNQRAVSERSLLLLSTEQRTFLFSRKP